MTAKNPEKLAPLVEESSTAPVSFVDFIAKAGEEALAQIQEAQTAFLQGSGKAADAAEEATPTTFSIPTLGSVDLQLPTAREVVEAHFALVDKYVANQKAFADQVLKIFGA